MQQTTYGQVPLNLHHRQLAPPLEPVQTTHQQAPSEQLHPPGSSSRGMAAPYAGVGPASAAGGETENARIQRQATEGDLVGGGREGGTGKGKAAAAAGVQIPGTIPETFSNYTLDNAADYPNLKSTLTMLDTNENIKRSMRAAEYAKTAPAGSTLMTNHLDTVSIINKQSPLLAGM